MMVAVSLSSSERLFGYGPHWGMMGGYGGYGEFGTIIWVMILIAVVALVVCVVRSAAPSGMCRMAPRRSSGPDERYARGEINRDECCRRRNMSTAERKLSSGR